MAVAAATEAATVVEAVGAKTVATAVTAATKAATVVEAVDAKKAATRW
jgi:hypothetical protein